nr:unnamed protein product [Digitaria exilis]
MVTYVPGLIFDEILVYAADNKQREPGMDSLRVGVEVDVAECRIPPHLHRIFVSGSNPTHTNSHLNVGRSGFDPSQPAPTLYPNTWYNGHGVPIELDPEEGVYMPEMIFGDLSSYEEEIAGGRNSCGVKLANLFSTEFVIETVDSRLEKKYKQVFTENMGKKSEPEIADCLLGVNWTKITFKPDLAKFHMTHIDDDAIALMRRRVADMVESFPDYVVSFISTAYVDRNPPRRVSQRINYQFDVCVTKSEGNFQQVSYVNQFATTEGRTHVDYVSDQIAASIVRFSSKKGFQVEECEVKRHLWVFVNASMDKPTFDSPTRDALTNPQESFGSSFELSTHFLHVAYECISGEISR